MKMCVDEKELTEQNIPATAKQYRRDTTNTKRERRATVEEYTNGRDCVCVVCCLLPRGSCIFFILLANYII